MIKMDEANWTVVIVITAMAVSLGVVYVIQTFLLC